MAILIGSSGAGDDLIRRLHDEGVSRSCTTIRQIIERREAIDEAIEHERMRQSELIEQGDERAPVESGPAPADRSAALFPQREKRRRVQAPAGPPEGQP